MRAEVYGAGRDTEQDRARGGRTPQRKVESRGHEGAPAQLYVAAGQHHQRGLFYEQHLRSARTGSSHVVRLQGNAQGLDRCTEDLKVVCVVAVGSAKVHCNRSPSSGVGSDAHDLHEEGGAEEWR